MATIANTTFAANFTVNPREIDFVTRFGRNWEALRDIIGISRPIRKEAGAVLKTKKATVSLQSGAVAEGDEIPYSEAHVVETILGEMSLEKYKKGVTAEAIKTYGYETAIGRTDDAFLDELQMLVMGKFYTFANSGELTNIQTAYQPALAMAKGLVVNKWKKMHRNATEVVAFANVLDVYEYLGAASITVQTQFGFNYIKDFMGINTIFLCSDDEVARGRIIATPVDNMVLYYVDPAMSDFARAGLNYTVDGETNLIGFHTEGDYNRAISNSYALMGMTLFAEYIDGIAVVEVEASGSLGAITVGSAAGDAIGETKLTITEDLIQGARLFYKAASGTAPAAPTYKAVLDSTWKEFDEGASVAATNGYAVRVVECNGSGQAISSGTATVVAKTS